MIPAQLDRPVTTTLIRRCACGPHQWWHQAVVCDFVGVSHSAELENILSLIIDLARVGMRAIALQPAHEFLGTSSPQLRILCATAHRAGVKVIFRIPLSSALAQSPSHPHLAFDEAAAASMCDWLRVAVDSGADGIDLALLDSPEVNLSPEQREQLAALIRRMQGELADMNSSAILCAEAINTDEQSLTYHLEEEWLHHLRDTALLDTPWDSTSIRDNVERALAQRDYLGHVAAWHWSRTRHVQTPGDVFTMRSIPASSWEATSSPLRRTAMNLFALSLPGAAYIPFAFMGGRLVASSNTFRRVWEGDKASATEARILREVLRIREERSMGTGSLAWVDGLEWARSGVIVHLTAGVLVVLNASTDDVMVPAEHRLLVASHPLDVEGARGTQLPPETCAWFAAARIQRTPVSVND